ncbi:hypothetical protein L210DRAFT_845869 [Boletus edulis BED1]|uniref:Uncharacterized protein n=1 Tax=Boletus edulis BED1 TaxID=1328754 RepID=A0AAD4GGC6_BOLED|nr:hypothetical protein L210DRAFT_845869 [Boletus edulis BED1]
MGDYANRHDISVAPRRYLQRQWKRNKPHLPPSDSLPVLRLCPNRPLFVCAQCGFANAWIPLCLWCEWTSTEATKQFEANLPRARRLSAPSRTVPAPRKIRQYPRRMSAESAVSSGSPHAPKNERAFSSITTVLEAFHRDMCHDDRQLDPHHVEAVDRDTIPFSVAPTNSHNAEEETVDGGVHRVATATSMTPPLPTFSFPNVASKPEIGSHKHDSEECGLKKRHRKRLPALCVQPPHTSFRASCHAAERMRLENAVTTPATDSVTSVLMEASSTPRSTGSMAVSDRGYIHSTSSIASSQCSPKRGLRRTKNMTLLPRGSSLSPRSRSPLRESVDIYPRSTVEARQSHAVSPTSSPDRDVPPVRLGHPSRPYYSAIRKDMSRPTSPVFSIAAPRTPSPIPPQVDYLPRGTKSLDCGDRSGIQYARELRPMSMVLSGQTPPMVGSGFSLSGEMELRMNLARWRQEDAPDEPGGYHFRETGRSPKMNMKGRVKQLGRGLKELVLGRS